MRIESIRFGMLRVPLKTPFKTAMRTVSEIADVVVTLETDTGHRGYGSAPATAVITGETHGSIIEAISKVIGPAVIGGDVGDLNGLTDRVQKSIVRNFSAKAAVEIALYDLFGQLYGAPIYRLLGGGDNVITTDITISVDYIDKMVEDARAAVEAGFETLKIKVGKDPALDIERMKAIHAAVGDRALIRLDANQGWTPKQAVAVLRELEDSGVRLELVEQPVRGEDIAGMKYVTDRVMTPVMADESSFGPKECIDLIGMRAADIINIKLMKTGGMSNAVRVADIAGVYGAECMIGCMLESSIGVAAAAHIAAAKSSVITRVDLDAPQLGTHDPVSSGVRFDNAEITIGDAPGLGITAIEGLEALDVEVTAA
jgi:L-alanine-DL-glutamate epimerase-like enolase superfamily enzyme